VRYIKAGFLDKADFGLLDLSEPLLMISKMLSSGAGLFSKKDKE
jgi:hypothetical protein